MKNLHNSQKGFVMLTAMVFLLVLTILALTAVRRATQGENIAKNMGEQNVAFQTAETALRYCQKDFELTLAGGSALPLGTVQTVHGIPINLYQGGFPDFLLPDLWRTRSNWITRGFKLPANTVQYVSEQPECIIEEWIKPNKDGYGLGSNAGSANLKSSYVITARAQGVNSNSVVWLQVIWYLGSGS
ncbi:pilus assembly PilX family protein [Undibacterium umbellatum]|uniref:Type 4 fimbrial biogenesis protein PilX N-terminal domain-containing protein n=1 Tax=Undibacterium umbellatum TaxID=2762300 RepID=A0ABR6ZI06_9BURK|nr:hypothetical protein [Undibacterium umbellatum]MBC3911367.1 hypothetical protein [Undibacterium umbellatum]